MVSNCGNFSRSRNSLQLQQNLTSPLQLSMLWTCCKTVFLLIWCKLVLLQSVAEIKLPLQLSCTSVIDPTVENLNFKQKKHCWLSDCDKKIWHEMSLETKTQSVGQYHTEGRNLQPIAANRTSAANARRARVCSSLHAERENKTFCSRPAYTGR